MNMSRAREQWSNIVGRFGFKTVAGCGCLGCLVPVLTVFVAVIAVGWWLWWPSASPPQATQVAGVPYPVVSSYAPVSGQALRSSVPTPVYPKENAQGGVHNPGLPSMMGNQPLAQEYSYLVEGQAAYKPYQGDNSLAQKSLYLAQANWSGERRTPYVKGQVLSNGMTVVSGDFDFVLLQDASGDQWFCDPTGVNCQWWR